ncbi:hypothetical protein Vqi01_01710 [Micromonospora qiuiae]|uniref:Ricin B lectin domain-containing protein n=1 Tax=Micromonospora qiuiae TaxID=502268 RepID=A0ABQ4J4C3_9ACTN|nr:ricin-type beta-trefoil lectin domain protein [Micromonospora qiuiae]GIJ25009.1 hypothetical protein Vqi01_01710 [Micromonospora qiuiae]
MGVVLVLALGLIMVMSSNSEAVAGERVTFVNATDETLWVGAGESPDGSRRITGLPVLKPGESKSIVIPDTEWPGHWRGRFFARQGCSGESGSTFKCLVGDCGPYQDYCVAGAEPVSLAEFNFDQRNGHAPWFNVSYVDALSTVITIDAPGAPNPTLAGSCVKLDCSGKQMLAACAELDAVRHPQTGARINCINHNRDGHSSYTAALLPFEPRAYLWSTHDKVVGNQTVYNCPGCANFTVTFRGGMVASAGGPPANANPPASRNDHNPGSNSAFALRGYEGKCIDVPGGISADGVQLQLWRCNGTPAQRFKRGPNGSIMALDKCMDVAWAARHNGAKVQLADCNGGPAQIWVIENGMVRNPHSGKCVDVREWNKNDGAPLQIWECNPGQGNQTWRSADR